MSKIIVLLRTLNEEIHLPRFLEAYDWVDRIIIADGGSTDGTLEIARSATNIELHHYDGWVTNDKGAKRNPEGPHMNFLIAMARLSFPDWIIIDECDTMLSPSLRQDARDIFDHTDEPFLYVPRMYIYGNDKWFPQLTGGKDYNPKGWNGFWAFHSRVPLQYDPNHLWSPMWKEHYWEQYSRRDISYPYALLHYFCFTPEITARKLALYQATGQVISPWIETCGPLEELPEWAYPTYYNQ